MKNTHQSLLQALALKIQQVKGVILDKQGITQSLADRSIVEIRRLAIEDQAVAMQAKAIAEGRLIELANLEKSPFFAKCGAIIEGGVKKDYYFAKHELFEENIYSWVSPIATIRFDGVGTSSFTLPNGVKRSIQINEKEQYMIVDGKVLFYARELAGQDRELIYQEHFTNIKKDFALPEIVAQMEKAQDQVIRAHHAGPMVISGPAGSGKTTLALHRVAYLLQAPDTMSYFSPKSSIVLVQDESTKKYFSGLLPSLGIVDVHVTTFAAWGMKVLGIDSLTYKEEYLEDASLEEAYEYAKLEILKSAGTDLGYFSDHKTQLGKLYSQSHDESMKKVFSSQMKEGLIDRVDLSVLLYMHQKKHGKLGTRKAYNAISGGKSKRKYIDDYAEYSLMVVDEFQNYLPLQLEVLQKCMDKDIDSIIYVGDIGQCIKLGTVRDWRDIGEDITGERKVVLSKVYRNTKNILRYIQSVGYDIDIAEGAKEGEDVTTQDVQKEELLKMINEIIAGAGTASVGVLTKHEKEKKELTEKMSAPDTVHFITWRESQGVEFDIVILIDEKLEDIIIRDVDEKYRDEIAKIHKDLYYVALTRAISKLYIFNAN